MSAIMVEFGTTRDGDMAARVGDLAYIAIPIDAGFSVASAWRLSRPLHEWNRADVYGAECSVSDHQAFRAYVGDIALHVRQREALGRIETVHPISTPWGKSQTATVYAPGIVFHSTAGHGGFKLDHMRNKAMPEALRIAGGWYEEDGDWARVAAGYPDLFTYREQASADRILRDWCPDAWEAIHGRALAPGESFSRERDEFSRRHTQDWVVISARTTASPPGYVEVIASLGGRRDASPKRAFLVPGEDYARRGRHGFVIDPDRHGEIELSPR